ncbi:MAG: hypothetical protein ACRDTG_20435 [Pseudonocardiaceae bacterium]
MIATVGLGRVPVAWIDQTRSGGRLLVPLDRCSGGGLLALLTVHDSVNPCGNASASPWSTATTPCG